jgi:hypothetical protein
MATHAATAMAFNPQAPATGSQVMLPWLLFFNRMFW